MTEALGLEPPELSLLAVLMLRGPQTPGELKQRSERLHSFADLAAVEESLGRLIEAGHVASLPRRPGQKEQRYAQLLEGEGEDDDGAPQPAPGSPPAPEPAPSPDPVPAPREVADMGVPDPSELPADDERLARLEAELLELKRELRGLREALGESPPED